MISSYRPLGEMPKAEGGKLPSYQATNRKGEKLWKIPWHG